MKLGFGFFVLPGTIEAATPGAALVESAAAPEGVKTTSGVIAESGGVLSRGRENFGGKTPS